VKVKRRDLLAAMRLAAVSAPVRSTMPVLHCFRLHGDGVRLWLWAANMNRESREAVDSLGGPDFGPVCVPVKRLMAIADNGGETIDITQEGNRLRIVSGASVAVPFLPPDEFPPAIAMADSVVCFSHEHSASILSALESVVSFASKEVGREAMNGIHLCDRNGFLVVEALSGHCGAQVVTNVPLAAPMDVLVPLDSVAGLCMALGRGAAHLTVSASAVRVEGLGFTFSTVVSTFRFPDGSRIFDAPTAPVCTIPPDALQSFHTSLSACAGLCDSAVNAASVWATFAPGCVTMKLRNSDSEYEDELRWESPQSGAPAGRLLNALTLVPVVDAVMAHGGPATLGSLVCPSGSGALVFEVETGSGRMKAVTTVMRDVENTTKEQP
jgi:DNA polymerase III sliding clamp (beta) subunit (PCNA family)